MSDTALTNTQPIHRPVVSDVVTAIAEDSGLRKLDHQYTPASVVKKAEKQLLDPTISRSSEITEAVSLLEFDNGFLLASASPDKIGTLAIDLMHRLQKEYQCQTTSEKMHCEVAALSFVRILGIQRKLNTVMGNPEQSDLSAVLIQTLSKELDRAHRQYFSAIQTLQYAKQPPFNLNLKHVDNVNVAGQQVVNTNNTKQP